MCRPRRANSLARMLPGVATPWPAAPPMPTAKSMWGIALGLRLELTSGTAERVRRRMRSVRTLLGGPGAVNPRGPPGTTARSERRDAVDLDARPSRERTDLDRRAGRWRLVEVPSVGFVDLGEVGHVGHEDRGLHHLVEARAAGLQHRFQVLHHALGLRADVTLYGLAGRRVDRELPRHEQEGSGADADPLAGGVHGLGCLSALHHPRAGAAAGCRHALDLDARSLRQRGHLDGRARRRRPLEVAPVSLVHLGAIIEVSEVD